MIYYGKKLKPISYILDKKFVMLTPVQLVSGENLGKQVFFNKTKNVIKSLAGIQSSLKEKYSNSRVVDTNKEEFIEYIQSKLTILDEKREKISKLTKIEINKLSKEELLDLLVEKCDERTSKTQLLNLLSKRLNIKAIFTSKSKGNGHTGVIKRFGWSQMPRSHGVGMVVRKGGSTSSFGLARRMPGTKMSGVTGKKNTPSLLEIVKLEEDIMFAKGSIAGKTKSLVKIFID